MVRSVKPHYMSRFHELKSEAYEAGRAVDYFDLTSDPRSKIDYYMLRMAMSTADLNLIDFIVAHHRELYTLIQDRNKPDDSPEVPD